MYIKYPIKIDKAIEQIKLLYAQLICNIYTLIINNKKLPRIKQDESKAVYSPWLDGKDYFIDWQNWSATKIKRFINAVGYPYDNAKAYLNGKIVKFIDVEVIDDVKIKQRKRHIGKVIFIKDSFPVIICKKGLLKLVEIRDEDNKLMINLRSRFE